VAVNLIILGSPSSIPPLVVSVDAFDPSTGQPGASLARAVVPSSSVPTAYLAPPMTTADFDTPANITSGASYAIVLSSSASSNADYRWLFAQNACDDSLHASVGPSGSTSTFSPVGDNSASFVVDAQPPAQTPEAPVVVAFPVFWPSCGRSGDRQEPPKANPSCWCHALGEVSPSSGWPQWHTSSRKGMGRRKAHRSCSRLATSQRPPWQGCPTLTLHKKVACPQGAARRHPVPAFGATPGMHSELAPIAPTLGLTPT